MKTEFKELLERLKESNQLFGIQLQDPNVPEDIKGDIRRNYRLNHAVITGAEKLCHGKSGA